MAVQRAKLGKGEIGSREQATFREPHRGDRRICGESVVAVR